MVETLIILFGMIWGSFLNVVIYRLPRRLSLVSPPSSCPQCGKRVRVYHNVPIFSYLLLRGKCRDCGTRIPVSYLMVEILTPFCFLLVYLRFGLEPDFVAGCLFTMSLIALGFIDYYFQILPDAITLTGTGLALIYAFFRPDLSFLQALLGAAVGAGVLLLIYAGYYLVRKKEGLGLGDVTMMLLVGSFLGWKGTLLTLILASFVGALVGVFFILSRKKDMQFALPFGTFLAPAAFIALVWGGQILTWYLGFYQQP